VANEGLKGGAFSKRTPHCSNRRFAANLHTISIIARTSPSTFFARAYLHNLLQFQYRQDGKKKYE
jgi:hypothetical protein